MTLTAHARHLPALTASYNPETKKRSGLSKAKNSLRFLGK